MKISKLVRPQGGSPVRAAIALIVATSLMLVGGAAVAEAVSPGLITEFSAGLNPGSSPADIVSGSDGNLWFTDVGAMKSIGRITPSGTITEFSAGLNPGSSPAQIVAGPDGNLWFVDAGARAIGRITPSGSITEFPTGAGQFPGVLVSGPDGNLWFTDNGGKKAIGRITPSGSITEFSAGLNPGSSPEVLVWVRITICGSAMMARRRRLGGSSEAPLITEFKEGLNAGSKPYDLVAGPDGNLWFTDAGATKALGRITPGGSITEFSAGLNPGSVPADLVAVRMATCGSPMPARRRRLGGSPRVVRSRAQRGLESGSSPGSGGLGPDHNVWFVDRGATKAIGQITTGGSISEFSAGLNPGSSPGELVSGPDGNLWFSDAGATKAIGRITTSGTATQPAGTSGVGGTTSGSCSVSLLSKRITQSRNVPVVELRYTGSASTCSGKLTLTLTVKVRVKKGKKIRKISRTVQLGTAGFVIAPGKTVTVEAQAQCPREGIAEGGSWTLERASGDPQVVSGPAQTKSVNVTIVPQKTVKAKQPKK